MSRAFSIRFSTLYPVYLAKVQKKGRSQAELDSALTWFLGVDPDGLAALVASGPTLEAMFAEGGVATTNAAITGVVCGVRVEDVGDPVMWQIRRMDKIVDELARGWTLDRIRRG